MPRLPPRPLGADPAARSGLASSHLVRVLRQLHSGRLLVLAAVAVGAFFLVFRMLADERRFYRAFLEGSAASFATRKEGDTMWRRRSDDRSAHRTAKNATSPRERYEEFARENGRIKREVEEALAELDKLAGIPEERKDQTA